MKPRTSPRLVAVLSLSFCLALAGSLPPALARAQTAAPDWTTARHKLDTWCASIKSIKCHMSLARYTNSKARAEVQQRAHASSNVFPPEPIDSNRVLSYFWAADSERWRCDCTRLYPTTGNDFSLEIYDGERYTSINSDGGTPVISGQQRGPAVSFEMPTKLHSNFWLGLIVPENLDAYAAAGHKDFNYVGEVKLAGRRGFQFRSATPRSDITVTFDAENGLPLEVKENNRWRKDRSDILTYDWSDIGKVDGIELPFQFKYESYDISNGDISWEQTVVTKVADCELNGTLDRGTFENVLRPGTLVDDEIANPGGFTVIGGNLTADIDAVKSGHAPPLGEPNVKVN